MQANPAPSSIPRPAFAWRAMTSVLIAASFLLLVVSGVVLYISPPGRVANWGNWRLIGLTKHEWTGVHTWFGVVFVFTAVFHLVFNFRPLMNYFRDRLTRKLGWRWEWVAAVGVCAGVFTGVQTRVAPFSTLLDLGERVKQSWEDARNAAPVPHAELLSLKELCAQAKVSYETALERLEARGLKGMRPEVIVRDLAVTNQLSAQRLYEIVQGQRGGSRGHGTGDGFAAEAGQSPSHNLNGGGGFGKGGGAGRQTLAQYCAAQGIALTNAAARLQAKGIKFSTEQTLREIAQENGFDRPYELLSLLERNQ